MTPCEKLGYKVGDKFKVIGNSAWFDSGEVVILLRDDGTNRPYFYNDRIAAENNGDKLWPMCLSEIKPLTTTKPRPAKQFLAEAIHASGKGWPDGANWAAQDGDGTGSIDFFIGKKPKLDKPARYWRGKYEFGNRIHGCEKTSPNWHQTVLSRNEYFSAYPATDEKCEIAADACQQNLDELVAEWQSAKSAADSASDALKAAAQAENDAREHVEKVLRKYGWL